MSGDKNVELVRLIYDAVEGGDVDALLALYWDDVVETIPGSSPIAGAHKGKEGILTLYGKLMERSGGTFRVHLDHVFSDGAETERSLFIPRPWRRTARP